MRNHRDYKPALGQSATELPLNPHKVKYVEVGGDVKIQGRVVGLRSSAWGRVLKQLTV